MVEQAYYSKQKKTIRAFKLSSGIESHSYSTGLQRAMVDFGIDEAFNTAESKLYEHYGIKLPISGIRTTTLHHAKRVKLNQDQIIAKDSFTLNNASSLVSETDGSMVPIIERDPKSKDKRKGKKAIYREARLSLAHEVGSLTLKFSGEICNTSKAGLHMQYCARLAGFNSKTEVHAVGDGALWIAEEVDSQFGSQAKYLVDFYHVSEYLAAASSECAKIEPKKWLHAQQSLLKCGHYKTVIKNLEEYAMANPNSATDKCYKYLKKRKHQLHYDKAIKHGLPIGSGEIESAHRYIIQARLKIAGAWWDEGNANSMIAMRTHRANGQWQQYWDKVA